GCAGQPAAVYRPFNLDDRTPVRNRPLRGDGLERLVEAARRAVAQALDARRCHPRCRRAVYRPAADRAANDRRVHHYLLAAPVAVRTAASVGSPIARPNSPGDEAWLYHAARLDCDPAVRVMDGSGL